MGIGFAVPADTRAVIEAGDDGIVERGWLGVQIQALTKESGEFAWAGCTEGALVANVEKAKPRRALAYAWVMWCWKWTVRA